MIPRISVLCPNTHFLLIGNGPLFFPVQRQVMENDVIRSVTTLIGTVPYDRAREYLAACDAFLSPTQPNPDGTPFFGSPTKLFEYMSLGKPIIASDLDQIAEVLQPAYKIEDILKEYKENKIIHATKELTGAVGILIPPHDVTGFVKAACWLFKKSISFHKRLGDNARAKACAHYTWSHHVSNIIDASK
jgi:glycosyltransferase involved in cell wall biosynthesis